jgi:hypothetical protein
MLVERLDQLGEVGERARQPIDLIRTQRVSGNRIASPGRCTRPARPLPRAGLKLAAQQNYCAIARKSPRVGLRISAISTCALFVGRRVGAFEVTRPLSQFQPPMGHRQKSCSPALRPQ